MARRRRTLLVAATLGLLATACTSGSDDSAQATNATVAPATSTSTTTTSSTSTTTTTTLPPGLQPQVLEYGLRSGVLWRHAATAETSLDIEIIRLEADGEDLLALSDDTTTTMATTTAGVDRTLVLGTADDAAFETVISSRTDEGTFTVISGLTETKETMTDEELAASSANAPVMLDVSGRPVAAVSGAPGAYRLDENTFTLLTSLGPIFSSQPVDTGDTWTFSGPDVGLGTIEGEATIAEEIELDDGWAFVIDFTAAHAALPVAMGLEDLGELPGFREAGLINMLNAMIPPGGELVVDFTESTLSGTVTFDPVRGIPLELAVDIEQVFTLEMTSDELAMTVDYFLTGQLSRTLEDESEATSFESASVLSQYEADPFLLADTALAPLIGYFVDAPDYENWDRVHEVLDTTPAWVVAGVSSTGFSQDLDTWVDVFALTNAGGMRGYPELANELIWFWTEKSGREVRVGEQTAYRATVNGAEWLVWNSDTHTFIVIGPRSASASALEIIIGGQTPYLWEEGDCLEFRDYEDELPFSPYGEFGLRHCNHGHEYEVLYSAVLPDGPDAEFPDDMGAQASRACGERFVEYVGVFPLESNIGLVYYRPDENEWNRGARYVACVIYVEDGGEGPVTLDTRFDVSDAETSITFSPGDCLVRSAKVPCSDPHDSEVTAILEYDAPLGAEYPDFDDVWDEMEEACEVALEDFGATEGEYDIESGALTDMMLGWDAGIRSYLCVAGAVDDDWNVQVVGSFREAWELAPEQFDA